MTLRMMMLKGEEGYDVEGEERSQDRDAHFVRAPARNAREHFTRAS